MSVTDQPYDAIDWASGTCRQAKYDSEMWFADDEVTQQVAAEVCKVLCPIMPQCRQWALDKPEKFGVWGGLTEFQRRTAKFRKARVRCPGCTSTDVTGDDDGPQLCWSCGLSWKT